MSPMVTFRWFISIRGRTTLVACAFACARLSCCWVALLNQIVRTDALSPNLTTVITGEISGSWDGTAQDALRH